MVAGTVDLILQTPSTGSVLSVAEAMDYLGLTRLDRPRTLDRQIEVATDWCQRRISGHRKFGLATYDGVLPEFPEESGRITFPLPPLNAITSVKYYGTTGTTQQTLSSTAYDLVQPTDGQGYMEPKPDETWPSTKNRIDAITIRFKAGYASASDMPDVLKQAISMKLHQLWFGDLSNQDALDTAVQRLVDLYDYGGGYA
jgi:hypothetical protein